MYESLLVKHCAPTLAGMKTGSLFGCTFSSFCELTECMRQWNHLLTPKGLRAIPARYRDGKAMIYVYRPARLSEDLQNDTAQRLLRERGYCAGNSDCCVARLMRRLGESEDVLGFIENHAWGFKCVGCWKVYGNADAAQRTFEKYRKCTNVYCDQFAKGRTIDRLTVAD